jgi:hypothetical protein
MQPLPRGREQGEGSKISKKEHQIIIFLKGLGREIEFKNLAKMDNSWFK